MQNIKKYGRRVCGTGVLPVSRVRPHTPARHQRLYGSLPFFWSAVAEGAERSAVPADTAFIALEVIENCCGLGVCESGGCRGGGWGSAFLPYELL
ncbi:MAG: hypothetical protein LBT53_00960 [Puniceicoccales bacterium]|nr:hypothetical protein [Puniceicoccales bacterium]